MLGGAHVFFKHVPVLLCLRKGSIFSAPQHGVSFMGDKVNFVVMAWILSEPVVYLE